MTANQTEKNLTIYTIGHSNVPLARIVDLLEKFGIKLLADVRSTPYSRHNPQFNRETLAKNLKAAGIEYLYLGEALGGWPKDPTCYKNGQVPASKRDSIYQVDYDTVMTREFFQAGIQELLNEARDTPTAIMCSEEDPAHCHRHHLIGVYLTRRGVSVLHIRGDGNIVKDEDVPTVNGAPASEQPNLF